MRSSDMLVYEKHNRIYAYGNLPEFEALLLKRGLTKAPQVTLPDPHVHKYNESFDTEQQNILNYWEWEYSPLRESDD